MNDVQAGERFAGAGNAGDEAYATLISFPSVPNLLGQHVGGGVQVMGVAVADFADAVMFVEAFRGLDDRGYGAVRRVDPSGSIDGWALAVMMGFVCG